MAKPKKKKNGKPHHDGAKLPPFMNQMKREIYNDLIKEGYFVALCDLLVLGVTVLADKFGWGKELLAIYCNEMMDNLDALENGEISLYELQAEIMEDYGILVSWDAEKHELTMQTPTDERA